MRIFMTVVNPGAYFSRTHKTEMRICSGFRKTAMHIVDALAQGGCAFYDRHKIVVRIFEALTVGSNAHKAK